MIADCDSQSSLERHRQTASPTSVHRAQTSHASLDTETHEVVVYPTTFVDDGGAVDGANSAAAFSAWAESVVVVEAAVRSDDDNGGPMDCAPDVDQSSWTAAQTEHDLVAAAADSPRDSAQLVPAAGREDV